jgi:selenide,water dikinase
VLDGLPEVCDDRLLVGTGTFDDAGVFKLSDELALVQSVDFFTPVVDDPHDFGRIAAANALSDIYAMGAVPLTALAVCSFPAGSLPLEVLRSTLAGGLATLLEAGVVPLGGHTVKGPEFTYGLAVTGTVHPKRILTNAGARPGDQLFLTKPVGTGVLSTALKREALSAEATASLIATMAATNGLAADACREVEVHALTDVTGYGLLGHALEMAVGSGVAMTIDAAMVPLLPGAVEAVVAGAIPGGLTANRAWVAGGVSFEGVGEVLQALLCDPQTSGGLLAAIAPDAVDAFGRANAARRLLVAPIGRVTDGPAGTVTVT